MEEKLRLQDHFDVAFTKGKITLDGMEFTEKQLCTSLPDLLMDKGLAERKEVSPLILLSARVDKTKYNIEVKKLIAAEKKSKEEYIADLLPFTDFDTGKFKILNVANLEKENTKAVDIVSPLHPAAFFASLPTKNQADQMRFGREYCRFIYAPYDRRVVWRENLGGESILHVNTFEPPEWIYANPGESERPLNLFKLLLLNLVPNKEHRDFIGVWIHRAIFSRNMTALVTRGPRGIGKTTLLQIIGALTGKSMKAQEDFFTTTFNVSLSTMRFVYKDEGDLNKKDNDRLKSYLNKRVAIQRKGIDVDKDTDVFASIAFSNNFTDRNYHLDDERKKSQPDLGDQKLEKVMAGEDIGYLNNELLESPEDLAVIGNYILKNYHPKNFSWGPTDPLRGEQFWKDVVSSQSYFYRVLLEKVLSREADYYKIYDIQKEADGLKTHSPKKVQPPSVERINNWLKSFRWKEMGEPIAEVFKNEDDNDKYYIRPHHDFMME